MYSRNPCCTPDDYIDPCSLCPSTETPTVTTLTVETLTASSLNSTTATITNLTVQNASIDVTDTEDLTIEGLVSNPDSFVSAMSTSLSFTFSNTGVMTPLTTPPIGTLPGFTAGVMTLTGQTGFLDIMIQADPSIINDFELSVDNSGIIFLHDFDGTIIDTVHFRIPIRSTDTSVTISSTGLPSPTDYDVYLTSF